MYLLIFECSAPRLKLGRAFAFPLKRSLSDLSVMKILNVAEKNDAAKNISALLSRGSAVKREGLSKFNKVYEFECNVFGRNSKMIMTSVAGHLLNYDFVGPYKFWKTTNPAQLFEAPIEKLSNGDGEKIKKTLEREIKSCSALIIWTDCDREGENIGFEIIKVCEAVKSNLRVYRAVFSEITAQSVERALGNLKQPNKSISNAVDVRQELDLRIGAAFTRFQTLYLQRAFPNALNERLVSYGSCQFPTLGFVVERFKAISDFKPEKFWEIKVEHTKDDVTVSFKWQRNRLFDKLACEVLFDKCASSGKATVEKVETKPKTKYRPKPLETVQLQKLASKKLGINAKRTLTIAENLYSRGLISYPRTETNYFSKDINLVSLVQNQVEDAAWGEFAQRVLNDGPNPFQGSKSDEAHPPIHPIKHARMLAGDEGKVYELIVRHFLACLSKHAEGLETIVDIDVAGEKFSGKGLMITAKNYLEVYPYEKWSDKEIPLYREGDDFKPEISMEESETTPLALLTEADLIALMEKHGIGTDATHAEHIETIKERLYVGLQNDKYFVPRTLGMGLVEGYNNMGYEMSKPEMRAALEEDLKSICNNEKSPEEVLKRHLEKYKAVFQGVYDHANQLAEAIQNYIQIEAVPTEAPLITESSFESVGQCPTCQSALVLRQKKDGGKYIGCSSFPRCRVALWFPSFVLDVTPTKDTCPKCGPNTYLLQFKFKTGSCYFPPDYVGCVGGCDSLLLEVLTLNKDQKNSTKAKTRTPEMESRAPVALREINDSGFASPDEIGGRSADRPPNCHCGIPAVCLSVKKAGPNKGREFYKCSEIGGTRKCDFFMWKFQKTPPRQNVTTAMAEEKAPDDLRCYCSLPCKKVKTTKDGPNKGRDFFCCGKRYTDHDKCNFFLWADRA